jgi:hypothetical protein
MTGNKIKPIKRHEALKSLSREHHTGLLLCWNIREGFKKKVDILRIKFYADYIWQNNLKNHFKLEEKYLFPVLEEDHELIKRALNEHIRLELLFNTTSEPSAMLRFIEKELEEHIRFEERVLFNLIQDKATEAQLSELMLNSSESKCILWNDEFWK